MDNGMLLSNKSDSALVMLSNREPQGDAFKLMVRFSNCHAKKDGHTPAPCGLVFGYQNAGNYFLLEMAPVNSHPFDEMRDQRTLHTALYQVENHTRRLIQELSVSEGVNLFNELNALCVEVKQRSVNVSLGDKRLNHLFNAELPAVATGAIGVFVAPKGEMLVERTMLSLPNDPTTKFQTQWTKASLDAYFKTAKNPFEGYWQYLDRDMDDAIARIGGKYTIALVSNDKGFDIIHIAGAQVHKSQWQEGMLKAHLTSTIFTDHYNATWIDATFRTITDDVTAYFESGVILTISFPTLKSKIRFSKVL
ncbi:MAG: hypothetical protein ACI30R_00470 [Sodaliphilus sp.]